MNYDSLWCNVKLRKYKRRHKQVLSRFKGKDEKYFLKLIVKIFKKHKWEAYHHDTFNPKSAWIIGKGFVDLVLVRKVKKNKKIKTIVIFAEVKTEIGYPTKEQKIWLDLFPKDYTFLWRPSDFREIIHVAKDYMLLAKQN